VVLGVEQAEQKVCSAAVEAERLSAGLPRFRHSEVDR
jgi:hypothetical protein